MLFVYVGYKTTKRKVVVNDELESFGSNYGLINEVIPEFSWTYQVYRIAKRGRPKACEDPIYQRKYNDHNIGINLQD
jgi:hypothetical protein